MKDSNLIQLIDFPTCLAFDRYAGGHDEQMQHLFIGAKVLAHFTYPDNEWRIAPDKQIVNAIIQFKHSWLRPCIIGSWNGDVIPDGYSHNLMITNNHHIRFIFEEDKLVKAEVIK